MKIATWNVNGFRAREKQFAEWLERDRPDVVCLQELKAERSQIPELPGLSGYDSYWHGLRAYSGVSLHVRKGVFEAPPVFSHPDFDMESRIVQAELGKLVLASVYVPNGGKDYEAKLQFLVRLADWTRQLAREGRDLFERVLGDRLVDVTRVLAPDNPNLFTWWAPWRNMRQRNIGWRIDYVLASPSIAARASSCTVLADVGTSDHAPVMMTTA